MRLHNPGARVSVPDSVPMSEAISRTTHMAIGAHPDDLPIMAYHGIAQCLDSNQHWFLGATVTNGQRSPRSGRYAAMSDAQMRTVRIAEEERAAAAGRYGAAVLLDYASADAKGSAHHEVVRDLSALLAAAAPEVLYTHNLADAHDTHVAVALATIEAARAVSPKQRPSRVYGCEVWRDLDWLAEDDKVALDVSSGDEHTMSMLRLYESQIEAKRYDRASVGRRHGHATFSHSGRIDTADALILAMDLTPLITDAGVDPEGWVAAHLDRTKHEIVERLRRLSTMD